MENTQNEVKAFDFLLELLSYDYRDIMTTVKLLDEYEISLREFAYFTRDRAVEYGIPVSKISLIHTLYEYAIQELYKLTNNDGLLDIGINYYGLDSIGLENITDDVMELLNSRIDCRFSQIIKKAI